MCSLMPANCTNVLDFQVPQVTKDSGGQGIAGCPHYPIYN